MQRPQVFNSNLRIIRSGTKQSDYPEYFFDKENVICNVSDVADKLNNCFVNVGPDLSEKIPDPGALGKNMDVLIERNTHTMFLKEVKEK